MKINYVPLLILCFALANSTLKAQVDDPCYDCPDTEPCIPGAEPWYVGGNTVIVPGGASTPPPPPNTEAGTCNNYPFILKANNIQSVFIQPSSYVGIGLNNSNPLAPLDVMGTYLSGSSNFRIYGDPNGFLESTTHIKMNLATGTDFMINEGPVGNGINPGINRMRIRDGNVLFGTPTYLTPWIKLHATQEVDGMANWEQGGGCFEEKVTQSSNSSGSWVYGVRGLITSSGDDIYANGIGVQGHSYLNYALGQNNWNMGVEGIAVGGAEATGVRGQAIGGFAHSKVVGVLAEATGGDLGDVYGVEAYVTAPEGAAGNVYAGLFWGDVHITDDLDVGGNGVFNTSDRKFKDNIKPISESMDKIMQLKPSTYTFRREAFPDMNLPQGEHMGLIAQELEQVLPGLVKENKSLDRKDYKGEVLSSEADYKSVNYIELIPLLISGMQEQQHQLLEQQEVIEALQKELETLRAPANTVTPGENKSTGPVAGINVDLNDKKAIVLNQNVPNPFAEHTVISYDIPAAFGKAQMLFYTRMGEVIKAVDITTTGPGQLNVFADDLSSGVYTYTLVVDGKVIDSRNMVKN